jgi:two-component system sensor histidine kinase KdpD
VDELAHTNAPGLRNTKRWRDVEEILDAGIDVLSTLNIQHLESLSDVIADITGVVQRETIPDEVVRRAEEIELVDLTQQGVRDRLAAGKIYPAERVDAVVANYFRPGNLGALRELALSWTADRVDEAVARYRNLHGIDQAWETRERVVVAMTGAGGSEAVVRRAARLAMRSRADLVGVHVRPTDARNSRNDAGPTYLIELLEQLGGRYYEIVADDVGSALISFARDENATQIVLGASRRSRLDELRHRSPVARVIREADDVDIHVISYDGASEPRPVRRPSAQPIAGARRMIAWAMVVAGLPALTAVLVPFRSELGLRDTLLIYLLAAVTIAGIGGVFPAAAAAVAGPALANWYFAQPFETWTIRNPDDVLALAIFLLISLPVGLLVGYSSRRTVEARKARAQAEALAAMTTTNHRVFALDDQNALLHRLRELLDLDAVSLVRRAGDGWETLLSEGSRELAGAQAGIIAIDITPDVTLVVSGGELTTDDRTVARAFATQIIQVIERADLEREAKTAEAMAETDRLRTALLSAVSHDFRTPLATIKASLTSLIETGVDWGPEETEQFLRTALEETERLNRLVGHLLDASRVQVGAVSVHWRYLGLDEIVSAALSGLRTRGDQVSVAIHETLPPVHTDPDLLERVVANLIENALKWSPPGHPVRIAAGEVSGRIDLRISDQGPGIPELARETVFLPFQRFGDSPEGGGVGLGLAVARGLLEAMGNELTIEDTPGGGTTMVIGLDIGNEVDEPIALESRVHG